MTDMTASEKAAASLSNRGANRTETSERSATGERGRLVELIERDGPLTDDEEKEYEDLARKARAGTLTGERTRQVRKRRSVGGDRERESSSKQPTASSQAASAILDRGW